LDVFGDMSDSQRYPCISWNDASYHSRIIKITDFIINLVLMDLLNSMQKLAIHLILQHQQSPWLHQQGGHQTILKLQGAILSLLLVEVNDSVGPQLMVEMVGWNMGPSRCGMIPWPG
jgi:hypothetical protein